MIERAGGMIFEPRKQAAAAPVAAAATTVLQRLVEQVRGMSRDESIAALSVGAAVSFIGGAALFGAVKYRLLQRVLPARWAQRIDDGVAWLAAKTEPKRSMDEDRGAVWYLQSTYLKASLGFVIGAAGSVFFMRFPHTPVLPGVLVAAAAFGATQLVPRDYLTPTSSAGFFAAGCFAGGIALGPMNWIAGTTTSVLFTSAISSTLAFAVAPVLTRGWIVNGLVSQFLSSSIALLAIKAIATTTIDGARVDYAAIPSRAEALLAYAKQPLSLTTVLALQAVGNCVLVAAHAAPVLRGLVDDLSEVDSTCDAFSIVASVAYAVCEVFKELVTRIARVIKAAATGDKSNPAASKIAAVIGRSRANSELLDRIAAGTSIFTFASLYLALVTRLQRSDDPAKAFRFLRWVFDSLSPLKLV
jgi:hypothetical protein